MWKQKGWKICSGTSVLIEHRSQGGGCCGCWTGSDPLSCGWGSSDGPLTSSSWIDGDRLRSETTNRTRCGDARVG